MNWMKEAEVVRSWTQEKKEKCLKEESQTPLSTNPPLNASLMEEANVQERMRYRCSEGACWKEDGMNDGKVELVNTLVGAILNHEGREALRDDSALRSTNERGDTPLHLAASRGFISICMCIIGENGERKDLIRDRNKDGETPLFRAVRTCQTQAFVYLHNVSKDLDVKHRNYDGQTLLHLAIWGEFLDLAIMIAHCYPELVNVRNMYGNIPLQVLASRPSSFKSGTDFSWDKSGIERRVFHDLILLVLKLAKQMFVSLIKCF
ncbi:hypothetical protein V8G54_034089 [Vigna mungo]|uniref:Uncharacterized protein n=1 Tax=Vigna mungo TaxID=3915 RepID=A0AAQ3MQ50_VIGMU